MCLIASNGPFAAGPAFMIPFISPGSDGGVLPRISIAPMTSPGSLRIPVRQYLKTMQIAREFFFNSAKCNLKRFE
ncbi:hypothetical protein ACNFD4_20200 [Pseudomonas sp. NY15367]